MTRTNKALVTVAIAAAAMIGASGPAFADMHATTTPVTTNDMHATTTPVTTNDLHATTTPVTTNDLHAT
ncbi:hypothetical protein [Streptomyces azureus]|uniref:Secreted protein n=2 Tax=Streptomyces azureus TaxID=146537 RepID=A0A0K8PTU9_STRAJ|nr:hypothetical protein [Streptomyces azureus]GAP50874.1 uncharacterized protein SAZU_5734 [Streptomyces azureus]